MSSAMIEFCRISRVGLRFAREIVGERYMTVESPGDASLSPVAWRISIAGGDSWDICVGIDLGDSCSIGGDASIVGGGWETASAIRESMTRPDGLILCGALLTRLIILALSLPLFTLVESPSVSASSTSTFASSRLVHVLIRVSIRVDHLLSPLRSLRASRSSLRFRTRGSRCSSNIHMRDCMMIRDTAMGCPAHMRMYIRACWKPVRVLRLMVLRPLTVMEVTHRKSESTYEI